MESKKLYKLTFDSQMTHKYREFCEIVYFASNSDDYEHIIRNFKNHLELLFDEKLTYFKLKEFKYINEAGIIIEQANEQN